MAPRIASPRLNGLWLLFILSLSCTHEEAEQTLAAPTQSSTATPVEVDQDLDIQTEVTPTSSDKDQDGYAMAEDCNDSDSDIYPEAPEACNGVDDNCNGEIDDAPSIDATTYYPDDDQDGYGDYSKGINSCEVLPDMVTVGGDCSDDLGSINPGSPELCDGFDNDCDGRIDYKAIDTSLWYPDQDEDGWGGSDDVVDACSGPNGYVPQGGDCDDLDAEVHPEAEESCDTLKDNNCDGAYGGLGCSP